MEPTITAPLDAAAWSKAACNGDPNDLRELTHWPNGDYTIEYLRSEDFVRDVFYESGRPPADEALVRKAAGAVLGSHRRVVTWFLAWALERVEGAASAREVPDELQGMCARTSITYMSHAASGLVKVAALSAIAVCNGDETVSPFDVFPRTRAVREVHASRREGAKGLWPGPDDTPFRDVPFFQVRPPRRRAAASRPPRPPRPQPRPRRRRRRTRRTRCRRPSRASRRWRRPS